MTTVADVRHIIIGTAGHIDHGKTRLVAALTGTDTDRLPEEKARGITIDLGFAHWEATLSDGTPVQFGVVDVPGHERFVKNMVAGATGINMALLVVAADDGVMPQTREHLDIMDLLGIKAGLVAVTKTDLVEPEFLPLVQAEIEELTAGTFLEGCSIVPVSAETGVGIEELKHTLLDVARQVEPAASRQLFRMPIDRVFTLTGHGTIVTGSVSSGEVHSGDLLELLPEGREVRVRSVESHGLSTEDAAAGQRTAINLAGVKTDEVERGDELATPGLLQPIRRLVVRLRSLAGSPVTLKNRLELNLHLGTRETPARLILKGEPPKPGESAYAELRLKEPVVAAYGQRFILRRISPALTVAGGTILDPFVSPKQRIRDLSAYGQALDTENELERLSFSLAQQEAVDESPLQAAWRIRIRDSRFRELLDELKSNGTLVRLGKPDRPIWVHRERLAALSRSIMRTIRAEIGLHQPRRALPRGTLNTACREMAQPAVLEAVFDRLLSTGELASVGENIGPVDMQVKLTKNQRAALDRMLADIRTAGLMPPTLKELSESLAMKLEQLEQLLRLCIEDGLLVKVADGLFFSPEALEQARAVCAAFLDQHGPATVSQLREAWGVTRKFAFPLCEFFDEQGITTRTGDQRTAGPKIAQSFRA